MGMGSGWAQGLGSAVQAGLSTYLGLDANKRANDQAAMQKEQHEVNKEFYAKLSALYQSWKDSMGVPGAEAPTAEGMGARASGTPAGQMQTVATPAMAPIPQQPGSPAYGGPVPGGLGNAGPASTNTPLLTQRQPGSPYVDPLFTNRGGLGG